MIEPSALVLFSGGQDSTVCLAWALSRFGRVETVGFDYRQRHSVELECRQRVLAGIRSRFPQWSARLGEDRVLDLGVLGEVSDTALTRERAIDFEASGLPSTFVPGRNLVFLAFAGAVAYRRGLSRLVGGMCETDYSGYPDCRRATLDAMGQAMSLGLDRETPVDTPLMYLDKAQTWALAEELGGKTLVNLIIEETHTCYLGDRAHRHEWGYGCGDCPACDLRAKGWQKWRAG
ncbi:MAG TPA: 7-cyano-7-deazaguanine synthase QueC [Hyphomonadaceae bacterium]|nr:7-cyano-7-deazaguanine synthase QueC [Hyphomonadaceae bacterium]